MEKSTAVQLGKGRMKGEIKKWSPNNAGGKFTKEEMSLRTAMSRSCNSITVQLR